MTKLMLCLSVLASALGPLAQHVDDMPNSDVLVVRGLFSRTGKPGHCVFIITDERDAIWEIRGLRA